MSAGQSGAVEEELRRRREQGYETARADVQAFVPLQARRILELGCSTGTLGAALKARNGAFVHGVEIDPAYAEVARTKLDTVVVADIERFLEETAPPERPFDCLIAADVLEHLRDPWAALARASALLEPGASVVVSLPNVLHWPGLVRLVFGGRWPRDDLGVFDRTHLRWFTMRDAIDLLEGAGLRVDRIAPLYPGRGLVLALTRALGRTPLRRYLAVQWIVVGNTP